MKKHFSIQVWGRVQGVLFRDSARRKAQHLGITGFVRNEPDGSVYLEAEGEENALKDFTSWCGRGSLFAQVERVETREGELKGYTSFKLMR